MGNCSGKSNLARSAAKPTRGVRGQSKSIKFIVPCPAPKVENYLFKLCMEPGPMNEVDTYCSSGKLAFESALSSKPGSLKRKDSLTSAMSWLKKARDTEESKGNVTFNLGITYLHIGYIHQMFFNQNVKAKVNYDKGEDVMARFDVTKDGYQLLRKPSGDNLKKKVTIASTEPEILSMSSIMSATL